MGEVRTSVGLVSSSVAVSALTGQHVDLLLQLLDLGGDGGGSLRGLMLLPLLQRHQSAGLIQSTCCVCHICPLQLSPAHPSARLYVSEILPLCTWASSHLGVCSCLFPDLFHLVILPEEHECLSKPWSICHPPKPVMRMYVT